MDRTRRWLERLSRRRDRALHHCGGTLRRAAATLVSVAFAVIGVALAVTATGRGVEAVSLHQKLSERDAWVAIEAELVGVETGPVPAIRLEYEAGGKTRTVRVPLRTLGQTEVAARVPLHVDPVRPARVLVDGADHPSPLASGFVAVGYLLFSVSFLSVAAAGARRAPAVASARSWKERRLALGKTATVASTLAALGTASWSAGRITGDSVAAWAETLGTAVFSILWAALAAGIVACATVGGGALAIWAERNPGRGPGVVRRFHTAVHAALGTTAPLAGTPEADTDGEEATGAGRSDEPLRAQPAHGPRVGLPAPDRAEAGTTTSAHATGRGSRARRRRSGTVLDSTS